MTICAKTKWKSRSFAAIPRKDSSCHRKTSQVPSVLNVHDSLSWKVCRTWPHKHGPFRDHHEYHHHHRGSATPFARPRSRPARHGWAHRIICFNAGVEQRRRKIQAVGDAVRHHQVRATQGLISNKEVRRSVTYRGELDAIECYSLDADGDRNRCDASRLNRIYRRCHWTITGTEVVNFPWRRD